MYIIYQVQEKEEEEEMDADLPFGLEVRLRVVGGWRPVGMYFHLHLSGSLLYCKGWDKEREKQWDTKDTDNTKKT